MNLPFPPPFLSGLETSRYAAELDGALRGKFLQKIHLCLDGVLALYAYGDPEPEWLAFSSSSGFPSLFITTEKPRRVPPEPAQLAKVLRHDIEGKRILRVRQIGGDRVVALDLGKAEPEWVLYFEILGRFANAILTDTTGQIRVCLRTVGDRGAGGGGRRAGVRGRGDRHAASFLATRPAPSLRGIPPEAHPSEAISSAEPERGIRVGEIYHPPSPSGKILPDDATLSELIARLSQETSPSDIARGLVDSIVGFSPLLAREAVHRFSSGGNDLGAVVLALIDEVHSPETGAYLYSQASGLPALVSGARLTHLEGEYPGKRLQDLVSAMAILGESLLPRASFLEKKSVLEKKVRQEAKRTGKDLKMAKADLKEGEREHEYRLAGEMILSHLQSVRKGDAQVTLPNLYGKPGETVTVDLDPVLPPNENADRFFKKAKKAARKKTDGALRVKDLETKAEECSAKLARIETATSEDDLEKIEPGVEGPERQKGPRKKDKIDPIRKLARIYHSRDGCAIWVGRGPRESDELRRRFSRGSDLWIHTRDLPGPHVIIHSDSKIAEFPQETILDAAHLAAHHGKARGEKSVPVYMTEVKNLRSPKHAPPGKVTVANDRGFEVRIDPERMKRLLEGNTPR